MVTLVVGLIGNTRSQKAFTVKASTSTSKTHSLVEKKGDYLDYYANMKTRITYLNLAVSNFHPRGYSQKPKQVAHPGTMDLIYFLNETQKPPGGNEKARDVLEGWICCN